MRNAIRLVAIIAIAFGAASPASLEAATIYRSNQNGCSIMLAGKIVSGDFDRFSALARDLNLTARPNSGEPVNTADSALCLDSPGGKWIEGRQIALFVHKYAIATRILADTECYSSCALIFMAGRIKGEDVGGPRRILNVQGRLGFHAPYFDYEDSASFSGAELNRHVRLTNQLIADLITFGSYTSAFNFRPLFPLSLLGETLAAGPNELALVDTVEEAARWGIQLDGHREKVWLSEEGVGQACNNFQEWSLDRHSEQVDMEGYPTYPGSFQKVQGKIWDKIRTFAVVDTGGMYVSLCHVELTNAPSEGVWICSRDESNGLLLGDCLNGLAMWVPWYYAMPPEMPLPALAE